MGTAGTAGTGSEAWPLTAGPICPCNGVEEGWVKDGSAPGCHQRSCPSSMSNGAFEEPRTQNPQSCEAGDVGTGDVGKQGHEPQQGLGSWRLGVLPPRGSPGLRCQPGGEDPRGNQSPDQ